MVVVAALTAGLLINSSGSRPTSADPYQQGPDPTAQSVQAAQGSFPITRMAVPTGNGFGGGVVYYPTSSGQGRYGGIAISPGALSTADAVGWYGSLLASNGFVVIAINTNGLFDPPAARGGELLAALRYLTQTSPARAEVDPGRLGVMGHSLGGGGVLEAEVNDPALKAAIPMNEWDVTTNLSNVRVPTMLLGSQLDTDAADSTFSWPAYNNLPSGVDKQYLELAGGNHLSMLSPNAVVGKYVVSWMKRFLDDDTRYEQFLCPIAYDSALDQHLGTCPLI